MAKKRNKKQQKFKITAASAAVPAPDSLTKRFELEDKWVLVILFASVFLAYGQIWENGLVWDDDPYITLNDAVKGFDLRALLTEFHVGNYHPLTMLSLAVEYVLVGESPWLYHFNNLWLHALNSFLVFSLIKKLNKSFWVAFLTAGFFALHPLHVESVAWAAERKDVLYTLFLLLSFLAYLKYSIAKDKLQYILSLIFFALACFSKGMAVVLPALLVITDWWFLEKKLSVKNLLEKIPYFAITLGFAYIATTAQKDAGADASSVISAAYTGLERAKIASYSFLFYWVKTILPINLLPFYPYPAKPNGALPGIFNLAAAVLPFFLGAFYYWGRANKKLWWALAFFIIAISTVLQILPVGSAIVADRYYYLSSIGPLFILSYFLTKGIEKGSVWKYLSFVLLAACGILSFVQVSHWENGYTLFKPAEKIYPQDAMILSNIGWYHLGEKEFALAKEYLIKSDNKGFKNADVCRTIGSMYIDEGAYDLARPYIERSFDYLPVKTRTDWLMALVLSNTNKNLEALPFAEKAVLAEPENFDFRNTYASVLAANGRGSAARGIMGKLLLEKPDNVELQLNITFSYRQEGNIAQEVIALKELLERNPKYLPAYKNIGVSFTDLGRNKEAVQYWSKAAELDPSGDYEYNIGINYANQGRINEAISWYKAAARKGNADGVNLLTKNGIAF